MGTVWLPPKTPGTNLTPLEDVSSVVIVGANGSGKSRLGAWMDTSTGDRMVVHRVSAHRALMIGDYIQPRPLEQATRMLVLGTDHPRHGYSQKLSTRWQNKPISHLLNDFDVALSWLFAHHATTAIDFREQCIANPAILPLVGESMLERAIKIWKAVMPQRELLVKDNKVTARIAGGDPYAGGEMSDGERVTLYLIGQCLGAPKGAIIVIDEPELHLHQAIQARLWDQIEAARLDCVFVYITHDLAFAASRAMAKKIWVKSFDGKQAWDWEEVHSTDQFPESLVLRILGSRRPIVFVEGEVNSLDIAVYRALYPERLIVPRSSCDSVVSSTRALRTLPQLHHADGYGLIDRDHRSDQEVASYAQDGVFAPDVAEIESLFLIPEAIQLTSRQLKRDPAADLAGAQVFLFGALRTELQVQINDRAIFQIQQRLNSFPGLQDRRGGAAEFKKAVTDYLAPVDPEAIYAESEALFQGIVDRRDYPLLLKHYNRKSLASRISRNLGLGDGEYPKFVLRLLQTVEGEPLRDALRSHLPVIPPPGVPSQ
jgi:hypothetical protein